MMRPQLFLFASAMAFALATPAAAQMDHSKMPGMKMPAPTAKKPVAKKVSPKKASPAASAKLQAKPRPKARPAPGKAPRAARAVVREPVADPHAGHDMGTMQGMATPAPATVDPHAGHDMGTMSPAQGAAMIGTNLPAGNAPAPPVPTDHAADRVYSAGEMTMARHHLYTKHGAQNFYQVAVNLAEYQARTGRNGYRWDADAWYGGDIDRLWLKTEGGGDIGRSVDDAQVQALYSRAIGPYFNVQGGVRYDIKPNPSRAYAVLGVEGLAPGFFDVEAFAYLSNKGDVLVELEGSYDQRITQRLILQPRVELNFAAQDVRENGIGSGLSSGELGLRLRYDIRREFAPYVGISYERRFGDTARFARAEGGTRASTNFVFGLRTWF